MMSRDGGIIFGDLIGKLGALRSNRQVRPIRAVAPPSIAASKRPHGSSTERTAADGTQQKRDAMAWNSVAPRKPRKRQPPSSKAELREMADKAVAGWTKPITRTPAQKTACPSCGHTESITVHWAKCPAAALACKSPKKASGPRSVGPNSTRNRANHPFRGGA